MLRGTPTLRTPGGEQELTEGDVVAFPRGSVPELVEPGVTGFIVENMLEMADVIRPGGLVDDFDRRRCRERAIERFSRERMVQDYERIYERAIASWPGARAGRSEPIEITVGAQPAEAAGEPPHGRLGATA